MNTVDGTVTGVFVPLPFGDGGRVELTVGGVGYELLTRDADTDVCFDGEQLRGSEVVARLIDADGPVTATLWLRDGKDSVKAKFTTGD